MTWRRRRDHDPSAEALDPSTPAGPVGGRVRRPYPLPPQGGQPAQGERSPEGGRSPNGTFRRPGRPGGAAVVPRSSLPGPGPVRRPSGPAPLGSSAPLGARPARAARAVPVAGAKAPSRLRQVPRTDPVGGDVPVARESRPGPPEYGASARRPAASVQPAAPRPMDEPVARRLRRKGPEPAPVPAAGSPRTRGAWTTPSVVVRRPDGTVVEREDRRTRTTGQTAVVRSTAKPASRNGGIPTGAVPSARRRRPDDAPADGEDAATRRRPAGEAPAAPAAKATTGPHKAYEFGAGPAPLPAGAGARPVTGETPAARAKPAGGAGRRSTGETPAAKPVTGETPAAKERTTGETPAAERVTGATPAAEPVTGATPAAEPVTGESPVAERVTGESPVAEPVTGATPAAEPVTGETPVAEATTTGPRKAYEFGAGPAPLPAGQTATGGQPVVRPLRSIPPLGSLEAGPDSGSAPAVRAWRAVQDLSLDRLLGVDQETRDLRSARLRRVGTRVGGVALAGVLVYAVFPVSTYLDQRSATERSREQIETLDAASDRLEEQVERLRTDEEIERLAREQYGLVRPGEESYGLMPAPEQTTTTTAPPPAQQFPTQP